MINHIAIGPLPDGSFAAAYQTPGCNVMTLASVCSNKNQAASEADRLNIEQRLKEEAIQRDRVLRGFRRIHTDLPRHD
jgi:hypothetical protein